MKFEYKCGNCKMIYKTVEAIKYHLESCDFVMPMPNQ